MMDLAMASGKRPMRTVARENFMVSVLCVVSNRALGYLENENRDRNGPRLS